MATSVVTNIAQSSAPLLSTMKSPPSSSSKMEETTPGSPNVSAAVARDSKQASVDTVQLSFQALQSGSDVKKEEAKKVETKKDAAVDANNNLSSEATLAKVQFVYNLKGDLITKYLDSGGDLIYQVPSKLMLLSKEADSKSNSSVDTRV